MSLAQPITPRVIAVPRVVFADRTYWGLRSPDATADARHSSRLRMPQMPRGAFYTHTTAARLLGIPLPSRLATEKRLHVTMAAPDRHPHTRTVVGHGLMMHRTEIVEIDRTRVTTPERTWCDLGGILTLPELVAAGDFLVHWQDPLTSIPRLACAIEDLPNRRHVRILRAAILYLSDRSDSVPESMLRVILAVGGFPSPVVTRVVSDGYGEFIAHTDFLIEELSLVLHYRSADVRSEVEDPWGEFPPDSGDLAHPLAMELDADDLRDPRGLIDRIWHYVRTRGTPR